MPYNKISRKSEDTEKMMDSYEARSAIRACLSVLESEYAKLKEKKKC